MDEIGVMENINVEPTLDGADVALGEGRFEDADRIAVARLAFDPRDATALAVRGYAAVGLDRLEDAAAHLAAATGIHPDPGWFALLSDVYRGLFRLEDALAAARSGVAHAERNARGRPLAALGRVYCELRDMDGAAEAFLGMLAINNDDPKAHFALAEVLLARGEFRSGWTEYEWRYRLPEITRTLPIIQSPRWNGMRLPHGRLLVVCEQGYGDSIQFARFLPLAAERVKEVMIVTGADFDLLGSVRGVGRVIDNWEEIPPFSSFTYITSLGGLLGADATTISGAPYLSADPVRTASWAARLAHRAPRVRRVGLVWAGRQTHANNARRSLTLERIAPIIAAAEHAQLVSLMKDRSDEDSWCLNQLGIVDCADQLTSFSETAAVIANLDLVITVDSSVAHLAGALGRPVWVMTPEPSDWRWGLGGERTLWYDSMRLFRQPRAGDWDSVISRIAAELPGFILRRS